MYHCLFGCECVPAEVRDQGGFGTHLQDVCSVAISLGLSEVIEQIVN